MAESQCCYLNNVRKAKPKPINKYADNGLWAKPKYRLFFPRGFQVPLHLGGTFYFKLKDRGLPLSLNNVFVFSSAHAAQKINQTDLIRSIRYRELNIILAWKPSIAQGTRRLPVLCP